MSWPVRPGERRERRRAALPGGVEGGCPVWGRPTPDRALMRQVKDKLDPGRLFNPGRFVDGI